MNRRRFVQQSAGMGVGVLVGGLSQAQAAEPTFPVVREAPAKRNFTSEAVEQTIGRMKKTIRDPELAWLFENCFPNTIDTTVTYSVIDGKPDSFVITGDIDAMWLRDSTAQVWPYLSLIKTDTPCKSWWPGSSDGKRSASSETPTPTLFTPTPSRRGSGKKTGPT